MCDDKTGAAFQQTFERFLETVHPDDRSKARETLDLCLRSRDLVRLDYRIVLPDGRVRWVVSRGRSFPGTAELPERVMTEEEPSS